MSSSLVIWMLVFTISICGILVSSAIGEPLVYLAMTGLVSLAIAGLAIRDIRSMHASGSPRAVLSASAARYMGLVWIWGALCIVATYFFIVKWHEWWHFFLGAGAAGIICLLFATAIDRDVSAGRKDDTILKLARIMAGLQFVGMVAAMIGISLDPDKNLLTNRRPDWAAQATFFFGALALALISAQALLADKKAAAQESG